MSTVEFYGKHRIFMERWGRGWESLIQPPGSDKRLPGPRSEYPTNYKDVLEQAKSLIDNGAV